MGEMFEYFKIVNISYLIIAQIFNFFWFRQVYGDFQF